MKKVFMILVIVFGLITITNAQGITNTLGGNTADDKFIVENSDSVSGLVVTGKGNVGIGTTNPLSKLSVGGDGGSLTTIYGETYNGRGVSGFARHTGNVISYGGYFRAEGIYGRGVSGFVSGSSGRGVSGFASGSSGRGIYGFASNTGDVENHGGYFRAEGSDGRGVYGYASKTGFFTNFGGYFKANGDNGRGVYGSASGSSGRGVFGYASGTNGQGVRGHGVAYDFYAANTTSVNYGSSSSIRWKKNIIEIDNPLEKLSEIRGVYFDWDDDHGGQHDVGMIAEEVGKVLPEIVVYERNGIDADGMDYSKLTPLLVEAVKALTKRVEELESR